MFCFLSIHLTATLCSPQIPITFNKKNKTPPHRVCDQCRYRVVAGALLRGPHDPPSPSQSQSLPPVQDISAILASAHGHSLAAGPGTMPSTPSRNSASGNGATISGTRPRTLPFGSYSSANGSGSQRDLLASQALHAQQQQQRGSGSRVSNAAAGEYPESPRVAVCYESGAPAVLLSPLNGANTNTNANAGYSENAGFVASGDFYNTNGTLSLAALADLQRQAAASTPTSNPTGTGAANESPLDPTSALAQELAAMGIANPGFVPGHTAAATAPPLMSTAKALANANAANASAVMTVPVVPPVPAVAPAAPPIPAAPADDSVATTIAGAAAAGSDDAVPVGGSTCIHIKRIGRSTPLAVIDLDPECTLDTLNNILLARCPELRFKSLQYIVRGEPVSKNFWDAMKVKYCRGEVHVAEAGLALMPRMVLSGANAAAATNNTSTTLTAAVTPSATTPTAAGAKTRDENAVPAAGDSGVSVDVTESGELDNADDDGNDTENAVTQLAAGATSGAAGVKASRAAGTSSGVTRSATALGARTEAEPAYAQKTKPAAALPALPQAPAGAGEANAATGGAGGVAGGMTVAQRAAAFARGAPVPFENEQRK